MPNGIEHQQTPKEPSERLRRGLGRSSLIDTHHIAFDRVSWEARETGSKIRENPSLKVELYRTAHNLLHFMTSAVPVPGVYALEYVSRRLSTDLDPLSGIDQYSFLLEEAVKHPKAKEGEKLLADLSIYLMRQQIPYIQDGIPNTTRSIIV